MALIKEVPIKNYGIVASYWKVGMLCVDTNMQEASFALNLYVNKTDEPNSFIDSFTVSDMMNTDDKTLYNEYFGKGCGTRYKDWQTACYEYVKTYVPEFVDAIDDPEEVAKEEEDSTEESKPEQLPANQPE